MKGEAGLYVHIPFCTQKCEYCDFYSITQTDQIRAFVDALLIELGIRAPLYRSTRFTTIFWGGGTPSLLSNSQIEQIINLIYELYDIHPQAEVSIEANPGTLDSQKLVCMRQAGFNRISLGVQSFNSGELKFLGRIHSVDDVVENVKRARLAGFDNLNIDLMTAFPGITRKSFQHSLEQAALLAPEHISCYTLIFEPGTVFYKRMQRGELSPIAGDEEAGYYQMAAEFLEGRGYEQYEVSNFARGKVHRCKHNLIYWQHRPYAGFGPSAHSFFQMHRFGNQRSLVAYNRRLKSGELPVDFNEALSTEELMFEHVFLQLRLKEGIDLLEFEQRFGESFLDKYRLTIDRLSGDAFVEVSDGHARLTEKGWMLADSVAAQF